jgi:S-adenosylmethionine:tRNA ribosyltransferase-isomerase
MRLEEFGYTLPPDLIAQRPASPRDASRLMVLHRLTGRVEHRLFRDLGAYLAAGDVLVVNDTRVIPARLRGHRVPGGGRMEVLLLRPAAGEAWEALVRPGRRARPGTVVAVGTDGDRIVVDATLGGGRRLVRPADGGTMRDLLRRSGETPLPPYLRRPVEDPDDYQTIYARADGAVAAPTAGLHFTHALLDRLRAAGVAVVTITLHVGPGTFQPVSVDEVARHRMDPEYYVVAAAAADAINARRGRLVVVGTTTVRALETAAAPDGRIGAADGWTDLFIYPGYRFRVVEALVTNFHLPKTTLLMLVSAFAGREAVLRAYAEAVRARYRFYSFGDAMLIV